MKTYKIYSLELTVNAPAERTDEQNETDISRLWTEVDAAIDAVINNLKNKFP